jgi:SdrD B-like domain
MSALRRTVLLSTFSLLAAGSAAAQIGPGPFASFPSEDETDGRFLAFGCPGSATFELGLAIGLATPAGETSFTLSFFDGETGKTDGSGKAHWDFGTRQLTYRLYADPLREGSTAPADLIGSWTGNDPNPISGPLWTATGASMLDNDWWGVTVATSSGAQAPSGNYFYNLVIESDGACGVGEVLASNIKVASTSPMAFLVPAFGLEAGLRQIANDGPIIYPGTFPPPGGDFVHAATTYDGTFVFTFLLPGDVPELKLYNGDFDHGTTGLVGAPSGTVLSPCADTDDPDTPAGYAGFPFDTTGAIPEGGLLPSTPPDDTTFDIFRRGELGDAGRVGCVRYELIDPNGVVYRDDNPSGNEEWEQFRIATPSAPNPGDSDYLVSDAALPAGTWTVRVYGLDMSNLNFWFADTCSTTGSGVAFCPEPDPLLLGDTVWLDTDGDGVQDPGEGGIAGVVMELLTDLGSSPIETVVTGDSSSPNWAACVAANTGLDEQGLYCFGTDEPGTYIVRVAASNFQFGGALAGMTSTTGGETQTDTLTDANVLTYDFGYRRTAGSGAGTPGYWMNHPEAWPVETITVGGVTYTKAEAIVWMGMPESGDKTLTMFSQLVAAMLNVLAGNNGSCINATIVAADLWMATYGPVGSGVPASSAAWAIGGRLAAKLDRYNNGKLCAPPRG